MLMLWGQSPAQPKKILIVDDHVPMRKLIADALGQASDYQIREARNGQEALDALKQDSFDLVISDVMMPGMGGMDLLNHIRAVQSAIPVIMVTAHPATDLTVSAMKNGAVD
ncbi:MAG: response regulator, partial [Desulfobacterales bacterium]|nr:response regulator [Desulfobacterales bacterium]